MISLTYMTLYSSSSLLALCHNSLRLLVSTLLTPLPSISPFVHSAQWRIHRGAMGAIAPPYGVEIILFIVVFMQKLNHYSLYLVQNQLNHCQQLSTFIIVAFLMRLSAYNDSQELPKVVTENVKHRPINLPLLDPPLILRQLICPYSNTRRSFVFILSAPLLSPSYIVPSAFYLCWI